MLWLNYNQLLDLSRVILLNLLSINTEFLISESLPTISPSSIHRYQIEKIYPSKRQCSVMQAYWSLGLGAPTLLFCTINEVNRVLATSFLQHFLPSAFYGSHTYVHLGSDRLAGQTTTDMFYYL